MPAMRLSAGGCFIFSFFFKRAPTSSSMLRSKISISSISSALAASRWIASSFSCFHSGIGLLIDSSFVVVAVVVVVVAGSFLIRNALLIFYGPRGQQLWKRFSPDLATMDIEEGFFWGGGGRGNHRKPPSKGISRVSPLCDRLRGRVKLLTETRILSSSAGTRKGAATSSAAAAAGDAVAPSPTTTSSSTDASGDVAWPPLDLFSS